MKGGWWGETLRPFAEVSCSWDTLGQECPCHCCCPSRVCPGLHSVWSLILLLYKFNTHQVDMEFGCWVFFQPTVVGLWLVFDNFIIVIYHITRNRWSNRIVSRISYSNHLADSVFLKFKCEVNSDFFSFSWATVFSALFGALVLCCLLFDEHMMKSYNSYYMLLLQKL